MMKISVPNLKVENGGLFVNHCQEKHARRVVSSYELIFVRTGVLEIKEGRRSWMILPGEALILEPDIPHHGTADYPADMSFYWVHFHLPSTCATEDGTLIPKFSRLQRPERMAELFHRFLDDQESGQHTPQEASLCILSMLLETCRQGKFDIPDGSRSLSGRAESYIKAHFTEGISTADVAAHLRVNPDYLGRAFKLTSGMSIVEAIHREQIREARPLLRESTMNIEEIATAIGFHDASNFRRIFFRVQGVSPRNYRKLYARLHITRH